jgi:hypothetical protein
MKQTATDYFYDRMLKLFIQYHEEDVPTINFGDVITEAYEQAKAMEKEQIMDAYDSGEANQYRCEHIMNSKDCSPEEHYTSTYNS